MNQKALLTIAVLGVLGVAVYSLLKKGTVNNTKPNQQNAAPNTVFGSIADLVGKGFDLAKTIAQTNQSTNSSSGNNTSTNDSGAEDNYVAV